MSMTIENLPAKYQPLWEECLPLLRLGRPGDDEHAAETVKLVLDYQGRLEFDADVLIPVAVLHDIGHSAILPEHFKYITGQNKLVNGKLIHMLAGAKIARDLLQKVGYDPEKTQEIIDIISMHDADQLKVDDWRSWYDTQNKKVFHDLDALDRYTEKRLRSMVDSGMYDMDEILKELSRLLDNFLISEIKTAAEEQLKLLIK